MQPKLSISDNLYQYALDVGVRSNPLLDRLRERTKSVVNPHMQIPEDEGQLFNILAKITQAKKYLEIGVFTGYSTLIMALAMGRSGRIFALDNKTDVTDIARSFWQEAGVNDQIELLIDDALVSLKRLVDNGHANSFDIAFIDANKADYMQYYEYCYTLVRAGGIILVDNVLMQGLVLEEKPAHYVKCIQEFNQFVYNDPRVEICLLPFADGLTILYKKDSSCCAE